MTAATLALKSSPGLFTVPKTLIVLEILLTVLLLVSISIGIVREHFGHLFSAFMLHTKARQCKLILTKILERFSLKDKWSVNLTQGYVGKSLECVFVAAVTHIC